MHNTTRDTYSKSAGSLSRHYDSIGSRDGDIELAFSLAGNPDNAAILELGCGNGRDAEAIVKYAHNYTGIDTAAEMIAIAKVKVPNATFLVADAMTYDYPGPYDIIFAFALFRHMDVTEITTVLKKISDSLRPGGIVYISSVYGNHHRSHPKMDEYGSREIYDYNPSILQKYSPPSLKKVQEIYDTINGVEWFELALMKLA